MRDDYKTPPKRHPIRVWWKPQVPMDQSFFAEVTTITEALRLYDTLANYDLFQLANRIKPDYSNAGGIQTWDKEHGEWEDCDDDELREVILEENYGAITYGSTP